LHNAVQNGARRSATWAATEVQAVTTVKAASAPAGTAIRDPLVEALAREREAHAAAEDLARRSALLSEASRLLGEALEVEPILDHVAHSCVPALADFCAFHLVDAERQVRLVAAASIDPTQEAWARGLLGIRHPMVDPSGIAHVIDGCRSIVSDGPPGSLLVNAVPPGEQEALAEHFSVRTLVWAPLAARGCCFGALLLANCSSPRAFTAADRALAEDLALRAAVAVDNATLYQEAKKALRARDELIAVASHELRTPLTVITLELDRLLKKASSQAMIPADVLAKGCHGLRNGVRRLSDLVERLLDARHIGDLRSTLVIERVDLSAVLHEVVDRLGPTAERAGSPIVVTGTENPVFGEWDRIRIDQVLSNLLANALKFGRGAPVDLAVEYDEEVARIIVRDRGPGVPARDRQRIFEPFERAAPVRNYGGLALGLSITRQIVDAHGGTIHVTGAPPDGATFVVELPRKRAL
jgi:signal transduction histidine kinase